jgi:hypothetical protein
MKDVVETSLFESSTTTAPSDPLQLLQDASVLVVDDAEGPAPASRRRARAPRRSAAPPR